MKKAKITDKGLLAKGIAKLTGAIILTLGLPAAITGSGIFVANSAEKRQNVIDEFKQTEEFKSVYAEDRANLQSEYEEGKIFQKQYGEELIFLDSNRYASGLIKSRYTPYRNTYESAVDTESGAAACLALSSVITITGILVFVAQKIIRDEDLYQSAIRDIEYSARHTENCRDLEW